MPYAQLISEERYVIYHLKLFGLSHREIGRRLKRHHTTISREMEHNGPDYPTGVYWHEAAQARAIERRCKPRHYRKRVNQKLLGYVERGLHADWSPETIVGRLQVGHPDDDQMRVSAEAVYRWVYRGAREGGMLVLAAQKASQTASNGAGQYPPPLLLITQQRT